MNIACVHVLFRVAVTECCSNVVHLLYVNDVHEAAATDTVCCSLPLACSHRSSGLMQPEPARWQLGHPHAGRHRATRAAPLPTLCPTSCCPGHPQRNQARSAHVGPQRQMLRASAWRAQGAGELPPLAPGTRPHRTGPGQRATIGSGHGAQEDEQARGGGRAGEAAPAPGEDEHGDEEDDGRAPEVSTYVYLCLSTTYMFCMNAAYSTCCSLLCCVSVCSNSICYCFPCRIGTQVSARGAGADTVPVSPASGPVTEM